MFDYESEKQLLRDVEDKFDSLTTDRIAFNKRYLTNRAQYHGKHGRIFNTVTNRLELRPERRGKPLRSLNLQGPMVLRFQQKLAGRDPTFLCMPATRDQEDVDSAAVAHDVLLADMRYLGLFGDVKESLAFLTVIDGLSFLKVYWDPMKGKSIPFEDEAGPIEIPTGDIACCIRSALTIGMDPDALSPDDAAWIMEYPVRHVRWVRERYGVKVSGGDIGQMGSYQLRSRAYFDTKEALRDPTKHKGDYTIVKEYYEAPTNKYPKGRVITVASGKVLDYKEENPYQRSDGTPFYPYVQFNAIPAPERAQGISPLQWTQPAQEGFNASHGQVEEYHRRAVPKVFIPEGSDILRKKGMNNVPFEIVPYDPTQGEPHFMPPQPLPAEWYRYIDSWRDIFRSTAGMSEATEGGNLANVRSAEHYMAAAEQEAQNIGPMVRQSEIGWQKVAVNIISIEQKFRVVDKLIRVTGKHMAHKTRSFTKADLSGRFDIVVKRDSSLPLSPMARFKVATMYYQMGMWGPVGSPNANLRLQQSIGDASEYLDPLADESGAKDTALMENTIMEEGKAPKPPHPHENHAVHRYFHVQRMNQPDFKYLPNNVQIAYFEHLTFTDMAMQQGMNPAASMQQSTAIANGPDPLGQGMEPPMQPPMGGMA